ncbi:hypothetical protein [Streptomyces akebiae]|uniref:Uncharacterized protein n=1 Tax=Streptomyces akebiae TaxID=2865673 RepID=A0ABX8XX65_9ACTN|nr:hypothetical protein [Streptomyces akebiae]QYX80515.1 hypothetical protein K1J60_31920 [Streptomyces akebiae]
MGDRKQARDAQGEGFQSFPGRADALLDGEADLLSGTDLEVFATVLPTGDGGAGGTSKRRVVGPVAPGVQEVRVTWSEFDGAFVDVDVERDGGGGWRADLRNPRIVRPEGARASRFVAPAPEGVECESAKVTG